MLNFGQALIGMFKCLLEEMAVLFAIWQVTSAQTARAQSIQNGFISMMKSGSHVCTSDVEKVSSLTH